MKCRQYKNDDKTIKLRLDEIKLLKIHWTSSMSRYKIVTGSLVRYLQQSYLQKLEIMFKYSAMIAVLEQLVSPSDEV